MNLNDIVSKSAPLLGSLLGSPLAGIGISWLANIFGVPKHDTDAIIQKITSDPEAEAKLKALEYQHREELERIAATNYQTEVDDRKSAREREEKLNDHIPSILAFSFLIAYAVMQFYCVSHQNNTNDIISARFQDILIMIIGYYFGSSHKKVN